MEFLRYLEIQYLHNNLNFSLYLLNIYPICLCSLSLSFSLSPHIFFSWSPIIYNFHHSVLQLAPLKHLTISSPKPVPASQAAAGGPWGRRCGHPVCSPDSPHSSAPWSLVFKTKPASLEQETVLHGRVIRNRKVSETSRIPNLVVVVHQNDPSQSR